MEGLHFEPAEDNVPVEGLKIQDCLPTPPPPRIVYVSFCSYVVCEDKEILACNNVLEMVKSQAYGT